MTSMNMDRVIAQARMFGRNTEVQPCLEQDNVFVQSFATLDASGGRVKTKIGTHGVLSAVYGDAKISKLGV
jgi:hypothetical protein